MKVVNFILLLAAAPAAAEPVTLSISGIRHDRGTVRAEVCLQGEFLTDRCSFVADAPAKAGSVTIVLPNVRPGMYAVQVYHDENGNGRMERNFLGIPREGYGFSNNVKPSFGPPRFKAAAVQLGTTPQRLQLAMRY